MSAVSIFNAPKGLVAGRFLRSLIAGRGGLFETTAYAEGNASRWKQTTPELYAALNSWSDLLQKAPVGAMDSTTGGLTTPRQIVDDFMPLVASNSALARLTGVRKYPANTSIVGFTSGASAAIVSEGQAVAVSKDALVTITLTPRKVAGLVVTSQDLQTFASSDTALASDLARAVAFASDVAALDPNAPYSISNGCDSFASGGATALLIASDLRTAIAHLVGSTRDQSLQNASWVMSTANATYLATLLTVGGSRAFPDVTALGGTLLGLPVLTTAAVVQSGSPQLSDVLLIDGSQIAVNANSGIGLDASTQGTIEMSDAPTENSLTPTASQVVSLFQTNSIALLAQRWLAVARQATTSCIAITAVAWV